MSLTTQDLKSIETLLQPKFDALQEAVDKKFRHQGDQPKAVDKKVREQGTLLQVVDEKFRHQGILLEVVETKADIALGLLSDILRTEQIGKSNVMRLDVVEADAKTLQATVRLHDQHLPSRPTA